MNKDPYSFKLQDYIHKENPYNTLRAYKSDWIDFEKYCKFNNYNALPSTHETIANYLIYCAEERSIKLKTATIIRRYSAIARKHRDNKYPIDRKLYIEGVLEAIARKKGNSNISAKALLDTDIKKIIDKIDEDKDEGSRIRNIRDKTIILLGFFGAFRRSEISSINIENVEELILGLQVRLVKSKTDQFGIGRNIAIPYSKNTKYCAVNSYKLWNEELKKFNIKDGPLFRKINKSNNVEIGQLNRMSPHRISLIIKKRATNAGLKNPKISGHSLRSGFATSAAFAGAEERDIMRTTGHKSERMVRKYIQEADLFKNNAAKKINL
tara:strand:+ start:161 stop:1132 length:972 start_codon:yes stop_codon:yes gene_type:complete